MTTHHDTAANAHRYERIVRGGTPAAIQRVHHDRERGIVEVSFIAPMAPTRSIRVAEDTMLQYDRPIASPTP